MTVRVWKVDAARGIAIIMMVLSNGLFDLHLFAGCEACYSGFWFLFARATAGLFILLVGVSLTLSYARAQEQGKASFRKYLFRGARIVGYGLLITAATWIFLPEGVILFGILHLIGISIILAYPFLRRKAVNLVAGVGIILGGLLLQGVAVSFPWLLWLGLSPAGYYSVDYTPLLPWFGVALLGVFLGNALFPKGRQRFAVPDVAPIVVRVLTTLGRRSLFIYLVHQPIIVAVLFLVLQKPLLP